MGRPKGTVKKVPTIVDDNVIYIENLHEVTERVKMDLKEKEINPGVVHEEDAGLVFKDGEPYRIINDQYVKNDEALVILQTRKVVREYLRLQELKNKLKRGMN